MCLRLKRLYPQEQKIQYIYGACHIFFWHEEQKIRCHQYVCLPFKREQQTLFQWKNINWFIPPWITKKKDNATDNDNKSNMFSPYTSNVKTNKQQLTHTFSLSERHFLRKLVNRGEAISLWDLGNSHNPIKWPNLVCVQVCGLPFTEQHKIERKKTKKPKKKQNKNTECI